MAIAPFRARRSSREGSPLTSPDHCCCYAKSLSCEIPVQLAFCLCTAAFQHSSSDRKFRKVYVTNPQATTSNPGTADGSRAYPAAHSSSRDGQEVTIRITVPASSIRPSVPKPPTTMSLEKGGLGVLRQQAAQHEEGQGGASSSRQALHVLFDLQVQLVTDALGLSHLLDAANLHYWWWCLQGLLLMVLVKGLAGDDSDDDDGDESDGEASDVLTEVVIDDGQGSLPQGVLVLPPAAVHRAISTGAAHQQGPACASLGARGCSNTSTLRHLSVPSSGTEGSPPPRAALFREETLFFKYADAKCPPDSLHQRGSDQTERYFAMARPPGKESQGLGVKSMPDTRASCDRGKEAGSVAARRGCWSIAFTRIIRGLRVACFYAVKCQVGVSPLSLSATRKDSGFKRGWRRDRRWRETSVRSVTNRCPGVRRRVMELCLGLDAPSRPVTFEDLIHTGLGTARNNRNQQP
ncbi:hypothetical protein GWK47_053218 [Chionoecetes opilio]|uniref:Uncharacterized protein n=1 Tax=Chionoecetes opilio TaxID=41210 RepID=A0A8J4Y143_CHIOP|nr:hypothetical protein GWK47_053218 [Chionoecetes opilio]